MVELRSPVGLIAGSGNFPLEFARGAAKRGLKVVAVAVRGETFPALAAEVAQCHWVRLGQLSPIIGVFRKAGVRQAAFAGAIRKVRLFGGLRFDWRAMLLLLRTRSLQDDVILRAICAEFEQAGIRIFGAQELLHESVASQGLLTKRDLSGQERQDAKLGWAAARGIGALEIGQAVVACRGIILAAEAVEGTDAAIQRAGSLAGLDAQVPRGRGAVVVKVAKPQQDLRLDLPTVGVNTIAAMVPAGATALVLEAGRTLLLHPQETVRAADQAAIAIRVVADLAELD